MKNKIMVLMLGIFLMSIISINAEMKQQNTVIIDRNLSVIDYQGYYYFDDSSKDNIGSVYPYRMDFTIYLYELPRNISTIDGNQYMLDNCTLEWIHYKNNWTFLQEFGAFLSGTGLGNGTMYYDVASPDIDWTYINLYGKDILKMDLICRYNDSKYLGQYGALEGYFETFSPAVSCADCQSQTFQTLSESSEINANKKSMYETVQTIIGMNYQVWIIIDWIVKIGLMIVAIALIFFGIYYVYKFISGLVR